MVSFDDATSSSTGFNDLDDIADMLDEAPGGMRRGVPELKIHIQGQKTILENFTKIVTEFKREPKHIKKYISTELGVQTKIKGDQLEIGSIIRDDTLRKTLEAYVEVYITCPKCGKPDTRFKSQSKKKVEVQCLACGNQYRQPGL